MTNNFNTNTEDKDEWLTPPDTIKALGEFDLDPCAPIVRPWPMAKNHYTIEDNGLMQKWEGRIWCNPPYGDETFLWLNRLAGHGNGVALIFARTETKGFHAEIWEKADAVFFFKGRLNFWHQPFKMIPKDKPELREKAAMKHFKKPYAALNEEELLRWVRGDAANAPSCLVAYGKNNIEAIQNSGLKGKMVLL